MTGSELYQLAQSGANISINIPLQELMQMIQETDRLATERSRMEYERNHQMQNRMMTTTEFCRFWRITDRTLRNWEKKNLVSLTRVGGEVLIDPEEMQRLRAMRSIHG